ncbi:MAG: TlyA family RNA methyltransferase [Deltaproteobacteria bacterium]|nr:TlyA family RNA methyltransferase [Deltaproteobacteria bacterium]
MARSRIDKLLVDLGLAPSRERARALIMAGVVLVDETAVTKAGTAVDTDAKIRVKGEDHPFVSRGGVKLEGALEDLGIDVAGRTILDVGASTGGFTDVCLRGGATEVYAVDVGTNQLAYSLRTDPRVVCLEQTNARYLTLDLLPGPADLAVIDVSFISITKLLVPVVDCLTENGEVVAMVKPQFEAGREKVGKGGVVRDEAVQKEAVEQVIAFATEKELSLLGRVDARIQGPKGNQETFIHLVKKSPSR